MVNNANNVSLFIFEPTHRRKIGLKGKTSYEKASQLKYIQKI